MPLTVDDAAGKRAYLEYDAAGNVTSTDRLARPGHPRDLRRGRQPAHRDDARVAASRTNQYLRNGKLDITQRRRRARARSFAYDANGNVVSERRNTPTAFTFARRTTRTTRSTSSRRCSHLPDDTTVSYTRDFRGNPLTMTDENGHTTVVRVRPCRQPDEDDVRRRERSRRGPTTRLNRLASTTDERDHTTTYEYDAGCGCSDRVTVVTDPLGHATQTAYDANGRRTSVTDANGHATSFVYDVRGHVDRDRTTPTARRRTRLRPARPPHLDDRPDGRDDALRVRRPGPAHVGHRPAVECHARTRTTSTATSRRSPTPTATRPRTSTTC